MRHIVKWVGYDYVFNDYFSSKNLEHPVLGVDQNNQDNQYIYIKKPLPCLD